jgi:hypothetical protein
LGSTFSNPSNTTLTTKTVAGWSSFDLMASMQLNPPEQVTVERKRVARQANRYVLLDLEPRTGVVVSKSERPSRFTNVLKAMHPVEALASFMAKQEVWKEARDEDVHAAMLEAAKVSLIDGETCRRLSRVIQNGLEIRAGLSVNTAFTSI